MSNHWWLARINKRDKLIIENYPITYCPTIEAASIGLILVLRNTKSRALASTTGCLAVCILHCIPHPTQNAMMHAVANVTWPCAFLKAILFMYENAAWLSYSSHCPFNHKLQSSGSIKRRPFTHTSNKRQSTRTGRTRWTLNSFSSVWL